jgi:hypothetical protein
VTNAAIVAVLAACTLALNPATVLVFQSQVSRVSATVDVVPGTAKVIVHIKNLSKVPLEAWQVRLEYDLGSGSPSSLDITADTSLDRAIPEILAMGQGPIPPGVTQDRVFVLGGTPTKVSAAIRMAVFDDLSSEGSQDSVAFVFQQRERQAATLGLWIDALESVSGRTPQQAKTSLDSLLASDSRYVADPADAWAKSMRRTISDLVASQATSRFSDSVAALKQRFRAQRDLALRHKQVR